MRGPVRLNPGAVFAQDFEVKAQLAEGGMGTVYAVLDRTCGDERALKVLLPELVSDERTRRRFSQESKIAGEIESAYVPKIFRAGIDDATGVPYILMELLRGRDLRRHVKERGSLTLAEARPILEQLGDALSAAHRRGLVHRDLKPENVFLAERGDGTVEVKLLDFGVAKVIDVARTSAAGTGAIGSPLWMAPEQTSAGGRIAASTDVFAYGLVAFYLMTGTFYWRSASDGSGVGGLLRELHVDDFVPASARAIELGKPQVFSPAFDAWFARAMARDNSLRYRDGGEALAALAPVFEAGAVTNHHVAFAQTMAAEVPADEEGSVTSPLGGNPRVGRALRGMAGEERHDTVENAFESEIPPTDPPPPMPVAEQPPLPPLPPPPPMPTPMPMPMPMPMPVVPPTRPVAPSEAQPSILPWIAGLAVAGLLAMVCSGAVVWIGLMWFSMRGSSASTESIVAPSAPPSRLLATDQRWSGTYLCGPLYPSTLHVQSMNGDTVIAELRSSNYDGSWVQRFTGTFTAHDRRLTLTSQDGEPIHTISGQIDPDGSTIRANVRGESCSGLLTLTPAPS
jgi:serine/threonine protein kinase